MLPLAFVSQSTLTLENQVLSFGLPWGSKLKDGLHGSETKVIKREHHSKKYSERPAVSRAGDSLPRIRSKRPSGV